MGEGGRRDDNGRLCANAMVDSYFGTQEGDFQIELKSISAIKATKDESEEARTTKLKTDSEVFSEKNVEVSEGVALGWNEWLRERCIVS